MNKNFYDIAISFIPYVGDITAKKLIAYCGNAENVFKENKNNLLKIPKIGERVVAGINDKSVFERVEKELKFIEKYNIKVLSYLDEEYPSKLKECEDSPIILYLKGENKFNNNKIISIVGTRKSTEYGSILCKSFVEQIKKYSPIIVSGLAYGIDVCAHKVAIDNQLSTYGIVAHGLDTLYPSQHKNIVIKMLEEGGGLVTEYPSETKMDKDLFPRRNRIIAGVAEATIVVEAKEKGGALITAYYANNYNRDVFTFPGRVNDYTMKGCNKLIKTNQAHLIENVEDFEYIMRWNENNYKKNIKQQTLFENLSEQEEQIIQFLKDNNEASIDEIVISLNIPISKISSILLNLEFSGLINQLPGKIYRLIL
ncbi:MAG: DNA protecting protein DprA [Bacteroidetes bacterium GWE2_29_8]|nr:MAG: DNA protecting protein DprA [Bacteroidetes bacterium GWE2_29_8]OFY18735.1 MAG: DNA protecting protein DprA [Bacteroidetes bacterium GWF2_29_10]